MKKIIFTTFLFFSLISFGQIYKVEYFDESNEKFKYDVNYRKVTFENQDSVYKISDYKLGKLLKVDFVKDTINWSLSSKTINYYKNGNIESIYCMKDNHPFGENQTFYENGNKKSLFTLGSVDGLMPTVIMKEFWDVNGKQTVINGNGYYEIQDMNDVNLLLKGSVKNGLQIGIWESNKNSFPYIIEEYDLNGNLISGKRFLSKKKIIKYNEIVKQAIPDGGINAFRKMIGQKIKLNVSYPVNDKVISRFIINTDGQIDSIKIIKGINKEIDNEVLRALKSCPKWTPGNMRGKNVKQYYTLPLKIVITPSN